MASFFRRSSKVGSSDQQSHNLEPPPSGHGQERRRSASRLRLPWSPERSAPGSSSPRGTSAARSAPPLTTRLLPVAPSIESISRASQPATSEPRDQPAILLHAPGRTIASVVLPIERIWQRSIDIAQEKLKKKKLPLLEPSGSAVPSGADISTIVVDLGKAIDQGDRGSGVGRWGKILKVIDSYSRVVDTAIQSNPAITALVWAGVRAILQVRSGFIQFYYIAYINQCQVALNHIEIAQGLEAAVETIVVKMAICEFYTNVYVEMGITLSSDQMTHSLQQSLDSALPELYAAVLVFSVKARQYFDPSNTGRGPSM